MADDHVNTPGAENGPDAANGPSATPQPRIQRKFLILIFVVVFLVADGIFLSFGRSGQAPPVARALLKANSQHKFTGGSVKKGGGTYHKISASTALDIDKALDKAAQRINAPVNYLAAYIVRESSGDPRAEFRDLKKWEKATNDMDRFLATDHGLVQINGRNLVNMFPDLSPADLKAKAENIDFAINYLADTVESDLKWASDQDISAIASLDSVMVLKAKNPYWLAALAYNRGRPGALQVLSNPHACRHADFVIDAWKRIDSTNHPTGRNQAAAPTFPPEAKYDPQSLGIGDDGPKVEALQDLLNIRLVPSPVLKVDGRFGPATRDALAKFQKSRGLEPTGATGTVNSPTWKALAGSEPKETVGSPQLLSMGDQSPTVKKLQGFLNAQLVPSPALKVDGRFGSSTRDALAKLQKSRGLEPTGAVDSPTWKILKDNIDPTVSK